MEPKPIVELWNCTHFRHPTDEQLGHVDIYFSDYYNLQSVYFEFILSFHSFIHYNLSLDCKCDKSSRRSPCDHSVGFVNVNRVIFRPIKRLKLIGSWVPKKSANFNVVKRKFNSSHYNILHCLLRGGRVWSW